MALSFTGKALASMDKVLEKLNQAYRRGILRVYNLLVKVTPVDSGGHKQAWFIVKGTEPGPIIKGSSGAPNLSVIDTITIFDSFTIYNAKGESAVILERGEYPNPGQPHKRKAASQPETLTTPDGFSIQAPAGIVGVNVPLVREIFREEFASVRRVA